MDSRLESIQLSDMAFTMCLFVGPKNSFALQNLTEIGIVRCDILKVVFSTSVLRCLSQLKLLRLVQCTLLKHIIQDDDDTENQNLSSRTCFPNLKTLIVIKCNNLKYVFPVSICKELPKLENLVIKEAYGLEQIFKIDGDQKVEIPNIYFVAFVNLPSLFHTQGILFQTVKNRLVHNCKKLSLTSASTHSVIALINCLPMGTHYAQYFL